MSNLFKKWVTWVTCEVAGQRPKVTLVTLVNVTKLGRIFVILMGIYMRTPAHRGSESNSGNRKCSDLLFRFSGSYANE